MYIEDNLQNPELVKQILKQHMPHIIFLSSVRPQEGIELAKKSRPDLILMDIQLPEMDEISAFNQLKRFKKTCDIPVIALSAQAMTDEIEKNHSSRLQGIYYETDRGGGFF